MNISASLTRDVHAAPPESTETQDRLDRIAYSVMFGTILENVVIDPETRAIDLDEIGRAHV